MKSIDQAVKILKAGGVVVYPTDTAYGLAVNATNAAAVKKLYRVKGRDFNKPVHVIFPNTDWLNKIVKLNKPALILMNQFLPGPLTIVLPLKAKSQSWKLLSAGTKTMGVRLPANPMVQSLVESFGKPITTTSANISGQDTCYSVIEVKKQFIGAKIRPDFYLNGGKLRKTKPSTVVSLIKGAKILRAGPITETQVKKALS